MSALEQLDAFNQRLAVSLFHAPPMKDWIRTQLTLAFTPDGSVGSRTYHFHLNTGVVDKGSSPRRESGAEIGQLARRHWQLTQDLGLPRWYKMTVTVERSGKFSVDFEYKDDYKEGDLMQRG